MKNLEEKFKKCFELAVQGETYAFPNPNVACVIYYQEKLVASGIHRTYGKAHAEVLAISNLKAEYEKNHKKDFTCFEDFASECELIINLEPCNHYGNTPPCCLLIKESGVKKIAFATYDTNPAVFKQSLLAFSDPSYELIKPENLSSEIQEQAKYLNRAFFSIKDKERQKQLPLWLTLKIASYPDGEMITKAEDKWITSEDSRKDVHRLRSINQVLISSSATIKADQPKYNVRHSAEELALLDTRDPDICVVYYDNKTELPALESSRKITYKKLDSLDKKSLEKLIQYLSFHGYQRIMVEAGPKLSKALIEAGLVDELVIYQPSENRSQQEFLSDVQKAFKQDLVKHQVETIGDDYKLVALLSVNDS